MTQHGKQRRTWPESAVVELIDMIERLNRWPRLGGSDEAEGEYEDWKAAEDLLRRYKPAVAETSSHASEHNR